MVVHTILVGLHLKSSRLLVDGVLRPISNWELEDPLMNINEPGFLNSLSHQIRNVHAVAGLRDYRLHSSMEVCKMRVFRHGAVIALKRGRSLRGVSDVLRPKSKRFLRRCALSIRPERDCDRLACKASPIPPSDKYHS